MKNLRLKFYFGEQKKFIQNVYLKSGLSTSQLAGIAGVHQRSFFDWRREKLNISLRAAESFCRYFDVFLPENKEVMINRWTMLKKQASRKGGVALFEKYGSPATIEGRRKGGIKAIANLHRNGVIPSVKIYKKPFYCDELAEFVGIMLGDGGITKGQCTITLNSEADRNYINFVTRLGKELFGEGPKHFYKKDCKAITLYYNGYLLVKYFVNIGLKIGNKVKQQVDVPDWIKCEYDYRIACLRGMMDTDGGVFLHKYKVNNKEYVYKKISFSNRSIPLLIFVQETLKLLGLNPKIIDKIENKKVWLYNEQEVLRYLKTVGTHNSRLLKHFN